MSYAKVTAYRIDWAAEQNFMVDNITTYLAGLDSIAERHQVYTDVQFQKHQLDLEIKLPIAQAVTARKWNYLKIENNDDIDAWGRTIPFYYYVINWTWVSQSTCKLQLSLDTLNTFQSYINNNFTEKTHVIREHRDRFETDTKTNTKFRRKIDNKPEIEGLIKYRIDSKEISKNPWYLVYNSSSGTGELNYGIDLFLVPKVSGVIPALLRSGLNPQGFYATNAWHIIEPVTLAIRTAGGVSSTVTAAGTSSDFLQITTNLERLSLYRIDCQAQAGGWYITQRTLISDDIVDISASTKVNCKMVTYLLASQQYITEGYTFYDLLDKNFEDVVQDRYIESTSQGVTLNGIDDIDRTKSTIVKIIECPYQPIAEVYNQYAIEGTDLSVTGRTLYLLPIQRDQEFLYHLIDSTDEDQEEFSFFEELFPTLPSVNNRANTNRNAQYESKLYNSEFYERRYTFDNFTKMIPFEQLDTSSTSPFLDIYYKQSNGMSSNMLFDFQPTVDWNTQNDYENILIVKKNSELPLYHNAYLDYMRTGYNYDIKAKNLSYQQQLTSSIISGVAGVASAVATVFGGGAFTAAGAISLLTNTIQSGTSLYFNDIAAQDAIDAKVAQAKAQATNVSTNDDLNLCNYYTHINLWQTKYSINESTKNKVFNLFYYTGYSTDEYKVPNINSRYRFNYLQADIDLLSKSSPIFEPYYDDVKARFNLGVTVIHTLDDFNQEKENWESWLI